MSYSFKLPYGLRIEDGEERLLHISEINKNESGLKCRCVCPNCGAKLQAKLPKTKKISHLALPIMMQTHVSMLQRQQYI